jgi:hypothetical protein
MTTKALLTPTEVWGAKIFSNGWNKPGFGTADVIKGNGARRSEKSASHRPRTCRRRPPQRVRHRRNGPSCRARSVAMCYGSSHAWCSHARRRSGRRLPPRAPAPPAAAHRHRIEAQSSTPRARRDGTRASCSFVTGYLRAFALCFASNDISASLVSAAAEF